MSSVKGQQVAKSGGSAADTSFDESLAALSLTSKDEVKAPDNYLQINANQLGQVIQSPKFEKFKSIGKFEISGEKAYSGDEGAPNIPRLIASSDISKLKGTSLSIGYDKAVKITDYKEYTELKIKFFLDWLVKMEYFQKVHKKVYKKPDIICFGGRITDPLISPLKTRFGEWEIYAAQYNDTVFIWREESVKNRSMDMGSYYGFAYESLLTGKNPATQNINELEKSFVIQEVTFGPHQILMVSEIDAQDDQGKWVEIKTYKQCSPKGMQGKYLGYWGQSVVCGVEKLVVGRRDDEGTLHETTVLTMEQAISKAGQTSFGIKKCYQFENRLLTWIKSHFNENNPKLVKKFSWTGPPSDRVHCSKVDEKNLPIAGMIPDWFVQQTTKNEAKRVKEPEEVKDCSA